jgi:nucleotide-binding universal stress UspA family protein
MIDLKRILVPTDFSETSEAALRYGAELARRFSARLFLLHVAEHPGEVAETEYPIDLFETMQNAADDRLSYLLSEAERHELRPECAMRLGTPWEEIVRHAEQHDIDLIVMGTHGRERLARVLLGSVAETVVRKAPCPVLTVHHPEHQFVTRAEVIRQSVEAMACARGVDWWRGACLI